MKRASIIAVLLLLAGGAVSAQVLPEAPSSHVKVATLDTRTIAHPRLELALVWATFTASEIGDTYTSVHSRGCIETSPLYGNRVTGRYLAVDAAEQAVALTLYFIVRKTTHGRAQRVAYILPLALGAQHAYGALHNFRNGCS